MKYDDGIKEQKKKMYENYTKHTRARERDRDRETIYKKNNTRLSRIFIRCITFECRGITENYMFVCVSLVKIFEVAV